MAQVTGNYSLTFTLGQHPNQSKSSDTDVNVNGFSERRRPEKFIDVHISTKKETEAIH